jgi:two-component system phosphorelay protein LuxU
MQITQTLLNPQALDTMKREVGEEHMPMLLSCFVSELEEYLSILDSTKDWSKSCADICHSLKSSAASFGATALLEKAIEVDAAVKRNRSIDSPKNREQVVVTIKATLQVYHEYLS